MVARKRLEDGLNPTLDAARRHVVVSEICRTLALIQSAVEQRRHFYDVMQNNFAGVTPRIIPIWINCFWLYANAAAAGSERKEWLCWQLKWRFGLTEAEVRELLRNC